MGRINNKGYTLVELIVSILVMTLVMATVVFFVSVGMREYRTSNADVSLQIESQTALRQMEDIIMQGTSVPQSVESGNPLLKAYAFSAVDDSKNPCTEVFVLDRESEILLTAELSQTADTDEVGTTGELTEDLSVTQEMISAIAADRKKYLLAERVSDMNITYEAQTAVDTLVSESSSSASSASDSNDNGELQPELVRGLVKISLTVSTGGRQQTVESSCRIRNAHWNLRT